MRENDTDPMRSETRTEPEAAIVRDAVESEAVITAPMNGANGAPQTAPMPASTIEDGAIAAPSDLLGGLRRDRPPPKLVPRASAASEGGEAVAYYGGPKSVPARFDTPGLESAVQIAITPPLMTVPSARKQEAVANAIADERATSSKKVGVWIASIVLLTFAIATALIIVLLGGAQKTPPEGSGTTATASEALTSAAPTIATATITPSVPAADSPGATPAPPPASAAASSVLSVRAPASNARSHSTSGHPQPSSHKTSTAPAASPAPAPSPKSTYAPPDRTL